MNWDQIKQIMESIPYFQEIWAPILEKINFILEESGIPNAPISAPLTGVMALLFLWMLVRLVRARKTAGLKDREEFDEGAEALEDEEEEEEYEEPGDEEAFLDEEPDVEFGLETEEFVGFEGGEEPRELVDEEAAPPVFDAETEEDGGEPAFETEAVEAVVPETLAEPEEAGEIFEEVAEEEFEEEIEEAIEEAVPEVPEEPKLSWFQRLANGLKKTKDGFVGKIDSLLSGARKIDDDLFDELEEALVTSDIGVQTAYDLLEKTQERVRREKLEDPKQIMGIIRDEIKGKLNIDVQPIDVDSKKPFVMMVVGVNGTGKTTSIGKIAAKYKNEGRHVVMAAADTFRAAAIEQLEIWSQRVGCEIIKQKQGSDPAAVAFDAIDAAMARGADMVIIDTAGRLHTKSNLMAELTKVKRVIQKKLPDAPHETLLVLDATTGQNAINQAKEFNAATELSGLILTKLDGTAKGGCIVGIADELKIPIRFIGIGEKIDDLRPFDADEFVKALF